MPGASLARSSDPFEIYRELSDACDRPDHHSEKIASQKAGLGAAALQWHSDGLITEADQADIIAIIDRATFREWRPVLYVIATDRVEARLQKVPREQRAGVEDEFIIADLKHGEFEPIEFKL
jgi:hypothetical protein